MQQVYEERDDDSEEEDGPSSLSPRELDILRQHTTQLGIQICRCTSSREFYDALMLTYVLYPIPNITLLAQTYVLIQSCFCLHDLFTHQRRELIILVMYIWTTFSSTETLCSQVLALVEVFHVSRHLGTFEEMQQVLDNRRRFNTDPETYCQDMTHRVPASGLQFLQATPAPTAEICSICSDDIHLEMPVYQLPCGHLFHADMASCLGDSCITTWLHLSKYCPNCKQAVTIVPSVVS